MSLRTPSSANASNEETLLRYKSLLRDRVIEVAWFGGDEEPVTRRNPASADRIVILQERAA